MMPTVLPAAAAPFVAFASLLRANGFAAAPEQTTTFLAAIRLLGPRSLDHIRRAAHATLAPPPERREEFDALFDAHFLGAVALGRATAEPDPEDLRVQEDSPGGFVRRSECCTGPRSPGIIGGSPERFCRPGAL